ncbi:hypothetical protein E3N88_13678 [Mikania micrantha]|uniref:Uncharacterized protein n=1 Tax=Mikania micrantha TaxID=192012 RepID=A0A5N6P0G9_9ASTR|nr:hypothetical protein E3N88_13678 [Mikania micrantha]
MVNELVTYCSVYIAPIIKKGDNREPRNFAPQHRRSLSAYTQLSVFVFQSTRLYDESGKGRFLTPREHHKSSEGSGVSHDEYGGSQDGFSIVRDHIESLEDEDYNEEEDVTQLGYHATDLPHNPSFEGIYLSNRRKHILLTLKFIYPRLPFPPYWKSPPLPHKFHDIPTWYQPIRDATFLRTLKIIQSRE